MKTLIVYYSRTGHNKKLSEGLAAELGADIEELIDTKKRAGAIGWIMGGRDAGLKKLTTIEPIKHNPADYDLVILASPLWVGTITPAIREYITKNKEALKQVAFVSVCSGGAAQSSVLDLEKICGKKLLSTLYVSDANFKGDYSQAVSSFVESVKR